MLRLYSDPLGMTTLRDQGEGPMELRALHQHSGVVCSRDGRPEVSDGTSGTLLGVRHLETVLYRTLHEVGMPVWDREGRSGLSGGGGAPK